MTRIGQLDRRLTLLKHETTENEIGEEVAGFVPGATVWAHRRQESARERIRNGRVQAEAAVVFTIRHGAFAPDVVTEKDRVRCGGDDYHIHGLSEIPEGGRKEYLQILTSYVEESA